MKTESTAYAIRFLARGSYRYAKSCAKNCVKILIGRKPYFTPEDVFFRLYLLQLLRIEPIRKITCIGFTSEGPGSQALMMMRAINFARKCGLTYVHTPFSEIPHADRPMGDWVTAWEQHFNLGFGEETGDSDNHRLVNFAFNVPDLCELFGVRNLAHTFEVTRPEFRRKYYANKPKRRNDILTVWVQVRRGEITASKNPYMWTSTSFIVETLSMVRGVLDSRGIRYKICVLSQGAYTDIAELDTPGTEIFLNVDPVWSMQEAIEADILIMAKSTFSYVSALISDGIKIYEECYFPPLSDWVVRGPNGKFDLPTFERQLDQLLESRMPLGNAPKPEEGAA